MKKLSAFIIAYLFTSSAVMAAEEAIMTAEDAAMAVDDASHAVQEASKGGLPQFDPTWFASQIFWLVISFGILYFVFSKKTLPDISGVIENRKNHIQSDLETAEKLTAEADSVHDAYQENLTKSQGKAAQAIQDVENDMKEKSATAFDAFRARSEEEIQAAEERINASKLSAMDDMNTIAAKAASEAVEKIIGKSTDSGKVKAIVESMNGKAKAA